MQDLVIFLVGSDMRVADAVEGALCGRGTAGVQFRFLNSSQLSHDTDFNPLPNVFICDTFEDGRLLAEGLSIIKERFSKIPMVALIGGDTADMVYAGMQTGAQEVLSREAIGAGALFKVIFSAIEKKKRIVEEDQFLHMVCHEVRNPLGVIRESLSQIQEGLLGQVTEAQKEFLQLAIKNIDRLNRTTADLLSLTRIALGREPLQKSIFDFRELITEQISCFLPQAREKGLDLLSQVPETPLRVFADRDKIAQVLTHLIRNAVKFTDQGSITVTLARKNGFAECSVSDTGMGISDEDLPLVFSRFEQFGKKRADGKAGTGLGLSICREIVEAHEGKIEARSTIGVGTCLNFRIVHAGE